MVIPTKSTALSIGGFVVLFLSLPSSLRASSLEAGLQGCQQRLAEELPNRSAQFDSPTESPNGTVLVHWQVEGISGYCRVTADDGKLIEFVNPYAVPRGQRPIENILAFQTPDYTVRIVRLGEQLYMNVYNRRTKRVELNRGLVYATDAEVGTLYTNVLGQRLYRSIVTADGGYRLEIWAGRNSVYDQTGSSLDRTLSPSGPVSLPTSPPAPGSSPQN